MYYDYLFHQRSSVVYMWVGPNDLVLIPPTVLMFCYLLLTTTIWPRPPAPASVYYLIQRVRQETSFYAVSLGTRPRPPAPI